MEKRKINYGGQMVDAQSLEFKTAGEEWNEYWLADGSTVKVKLVVLDIVRVDGRFDANDDPVYLVKSQNVVQIHAPSKLRKNAGEEQ